jgi:hypothetical protein
MPSRSWLKESLANYTNRRITISQNMRNQSIDHVIYRLRLMTLKSGSFNRANRYTQIKRGKKDLRRKGTELMSRKIIWRKRPRSLIKTLKISNLSRRIY